jgi:hypothetical protein
MIADCFWPPKARAVCGLMIPAIAHTVWEKTVAFAEAANEPEDLAPAVGIAASPKVAARTATPFPYYRSIDLRRLQSLRPGGQMGRSG